MCVCYAMCTLCNVCVRCVMCVLCNVKLNQMMFVLSAYNTLEQDTPVTQVF